MDDTEYTELLQYARTQVRTRGRADLDVRALERASRAVDGYGQLVSYLEALRLEILLQSSRGLEGAMQIFSTIPTSTGGSIQGIVVEVAPQDERALGVDRIDLAGSAQMDDLLDQIDQLLFDLQDEDGQ